MENNGGRVKTRELYKAIIKQDEKREEMERRIMERFDVYAPLIERVNNNSKQTELNTGKIELNHAAIDSLKASDKRWGIGIGAISMGFAAFVAWLKGS